MGPCNTVGWRCVRGNGPLRPVSRRSARRALLRGAVRAAGRLSAAASVVAAVALLTGGCEPAHDCGASVPAALAPPEPGSLRALNPQALERLELERSLDTPPPEHWLALVPGTSEEWGHHRAPPPEVEARGQRISREFADRLDLAYQLLKSGATRFLLLSGGAVDPDRPDYIEAERGRDYLLSRYAASFPGDEPLAAHLLVDPLAQTTPENVRNADKLAAELGLVRLLIVTTTPQRATLSLPDLATQGYYLLQHDTSTFDSRCSSELGYKLGGFRRQWVTLPDGSSRAVIHHCQFNLPSLHGDLVWP
jgi:hypothetical protein